ncbi:MAG: class I SAM-dependent methyltransferase [Planctomycetota bacterium]
MRDVSYWSRRHDYAGADAPSARAFAEPKAALIAKTLGLTGGEPVLDVGAGTGHLTMAFRRRGHPVTALDASPAMLARNPAGARVLADASKLPFPDGAFALAVEANLLHHVADPVAVLAEMARVSRGAVAVVEPNRNHPPMLLFSLIVREERAGLRFHPRRLRRLGDAAGLVALRIVPTGWVYQNRTPPWLARRLGRRNGSCPLAAYAVGVFAKEERG